MQTKYSITELLNLAHEPLPVFRLYALRCILKRTRGVCLLGTRGYRIHRTNRFDALFGTQSVISPELPAIGDLPNDKRYKHVCRTINSMIRQDTGPAFQGKGDVENPDSRAHDGKAGREGIFEPDSARTPFVLKWVIHACYRAGIRRSTAREAYACAMGHDRASKGNIVPGSRCGPHCIRQNVATTPCRTCKLHYINTARAIEQKENLPRRFGTIRFTRPVRLPSHFRGNRVIFDDEEVMPRAFREHHGAKAARPVKRYDRIGYMSKELGGIATPFVHHTKYWYFLRKTGTWSQSTHHPYEDEFLYREDL